jgi:UDP-N-acetylmuramoyl-L-alanyl-D-glutamate--2,6-diaminopimelate ligase
MRLRDFLVHQEITACDGNLDQEVTGLSYDSRRVTRGHIFFALPGEKADGREFIGDALERGAAAVVVADKAESPGATIIRVRDVRVALGLWSAQFFGHPTNHVKLVGITGTNGKTTTSYLVESILRAAGLEPGVIGTINYRYRDEVLPSHHTTPESLDLQMLSADMVRAGVKSVVMEVSSHALAQERVRGLEFDVGLFTNLSRDHLDYHESMENYFQAKSRLFTEYLPASEKAKKAAVINAGDPRGTELLARVQELGLDALSYGREGDWDIHPLKVRSDVSGLSGSIKAKELVIDFKSRLIGLANLENILGAVAVGCALDLPADIIGQGLANLCSVPGRLEKIDNRRGVAVLIDYAHSPDALEKVISAVRPLTKKKVLTVFGCGGDRDRGKRPMMGQIASRLSDLLVITSDNPRTEDPQSILREIELGVASNGLRKLDSCTAQSPVERGYCVEADRREAIAIALRWAQPGDVVLIAGKGHEDYQILGSRKIHFDDREVARELMCNETNS